MIARTRILQSVVARSRQSAARCGRDAFTLLELLVVVGIIAFLMSLTAVALGTALNQARVAATRATITKINGILQQRMNSFDRWLERTKNRGQFETLKQARLGRLRLAFASSGVTPNRRMQGLLETLVRKDLFREKFPQRFAEIPGALDATGTQVSTAALLSIIRTESSSGTLSVADFELRHTPETESAEVLYYMLTQADVFGSSAVDTARFSSSEVADTDGDGLMEFVDAWGRPLRFYRWPTQLFRPALAPIPPGTALSPLTLDTMTQMYPFPAFASNPIGRGYASLLFSDLPPAIVNQADPLTRDADDPYGEIQAAIEAGLFNYNWFATNFHIPNTYHSPLVVSAGPDGALGMFEPCDWSSATAAADRRLVLQPTTNGGRWAAIEGLPLVSDSVLLDNISNRNIGIK